jgi:hypothetical protein
MRAFFVTAAMYAGKDALWITDRTGHTSLGMLRTYERDVRRWRELGEAPVEVAAAIPEVAATLAAALAAANSKTSPEPVPPLAAATRKCTGRESNPYALRRRNLKPGADEGSFTIVQDSASSVDGIAPDGEPSFGVLPRSAAAGEVDPVDVALARALADASTAGRFDVVLQLAKELEARRLERVARLQVLGTEDEEKRP